MERTEVMVYFTIFGDGFPLEVVTQKLGVPSILTYTKGDLIPNRRSKMHYKESAWELSTGYQDSLDVNEQLQQVISQLVGKETVITEDIENVLTVMQVLYCHCNQQRGNTFVILGQKRNSLCGKYRSRV